MRRRRLWGWALTVVMVAVVAWAGWVGYQALKVQRSLTAAAEAASQVLAAAQAGDDRQLEAKLDELGSASSDAAARTDTWSWSLATVLPFVGDDAEGVQVASAVLADLTDGASRRVVDGLDDLDTLVPDEGRVDVEAVEALQDPISSTAADLAEGRDRLAAVDSTGFVGLFRDKYDELLSETTRAANGLAAADAAASVLPTMLGAEGPQRYLLVFQNNAEIRATGGLPGSAALVTAQDGAIDLVRQVPGASFGRRDGSVLPLTPGELSLYGPELGTYFLDANFTPNFSRAAQLWQARWQERYPGRIDGVIGLDTVALGYLMDGMSPVTVDGVRLTSENVVDELLHQVYLRYERPADQDAFFRQVAAQVFDRVSAGEVDPRKLLAALGRAGNEGRAQLAVSDDAVADRLKGARVLGPGSVDGADSDVMVTFNDTTAAKLSYFFRSDVRTRSVYCMDDQQAYEVDMRLESLAPRDAGQLPPYVAGTGPQQPGDQVVTIRVFTPVDGSLGDLRINGASVDAEEQLFEGREVLTTYVGLRPGEITDLSLRMLSGDGQGGATRIFRTPGLDAGAWDDVPSACGS